MAGRRIQTEPLNLAQEFPLEKLFFSTTDSHGVIRHGNELFVTISGFQEDELVGSPHSLIRHPSMPRAVFGLWWKTILAGHSIAAYVKNLANNGRYYWVLALVMPCEGGYLSIRLKPSTPIFERVKTLYDELRETERLIEIDPKKRQDAMTASTGLLHTRLAELGFESYEHFMLAALADELRSRKRLMQNHKRAIVTPTDSRLASVVQHCQTLDRRIQSAFSKIEQFRRANQTMIEKSQTMIDLSELIRTLSLNATINSASLGRSGATLEVVAEALRVTSDEGHETTNRLVGTMRSVVRSLDRLMFDLSAMSLQSEVSQQFVQEISSSRLAHPERINESLGILFHEMAKRCQQVFAGLASAGKIMPDLVAQVNGLTRTTRSMRFIQFAGEKESRGRVSTQSFARVFEQVKERITATKNECHFLASAVSNVACDINQLISEQPDFQNDMSKLVAIGF